ncbi:HAD family hydrolase [Candidatus Bathyarchaeota archaeon]|nr:MAG: HAD family hydrolase [Candidatus Bathyarchaeota archaeon]
MRFPVVIFDFDYTLADSSRGVLECINHAFKGMGLPKVVAEDAQRTIGLSLPNILVTLAGREHEGRGGEFGRLFVEKANEVMTDLTFVFEEVPEVIRRLKDEGLTLGIVSTKFRRRIEEILGREDLLEPFDVIVGGEDVSRHKPDPEGLLAAIERLGGSPSGSLYVGDSVTDAETARRAGVPFAAVLNGVTPREAFKDYPAYKILDNLGELIDQS